MYTPFLSHIITGALLAAANALAVPVTTTDDQPDGYYSVQYNDDGTSTPLDFIPFADLNITGSTAVIAERDLISYAPELEPRKTRVVCETGPLNEQDLVNAWTCLMSVGGGVTYNKRVWAWCKSGGTVAYFCNYEQNFVTRDIVQNLQTTISNTCGRLQSGYMHCNNQDCGVNDLTVGRKPNGVEFCVSGFTG